MTHLKALIDGDVIVYRAGFAGNDKLEASLGNVKLLLKAILNTLETDDYQVYISSDDKSNFRYVVAKTQEYKGNRKNASRPNYYKEIRKYLKEKWGAEEVSGMEADDALGIAQNESTIMCSIDKDLNMVPGWHYNFVTKEKYYIQDDDNLNLSIDKKGKRKTYKLDRGGLKWFYAQTLLGDICDNIPGIRGLGPVAVDNILKNCYTEKEMIDTVWEIYKERGLSKERLLEVVDLLWIRRVPDQRKSEYLKCLIKTKS